MRWPVAKKSMRSLPVEKGPSSIVEFIGKQARFPNAVYTLAAHTGVLMVIFPATKTGRKTFQMQVWDIVYPHFKALENQHEILDGCS